MFQKAKFWFLTNNTELLKFNRELNRNGGITEIVMPDALTGLLWLKNPTSLIEKVKSVGLSELMAVTLNEEIASKELINDFETTIKGLDSVSQEDYRILLESVAHESAKKIEQFNEIAEKDKGEAIILAQKIVQKERSRRAKSQKEIKDAQAAQKEAISAKDELQQRLSTIERNLTETKTESEYSKTEIEKLSEALQKQEELIKTQLRKIYTWLAVFIAFMVAFILILLFKDSIGTVWKYITGLLTASGWLWGLFNFAINLYKLTKGK